MQVNTPITELISPIERKKPSLINFLQSGEHDSWAREENDQNQPYNEKEEPYECKMSFDDSHIFPENVKWFWSLMDNQNILSVAVVSIRTDQIITFTIS